MAAMASAASQRAAAEITILMEQELARAAASGVVEATRLLVRRLEADGHGCVVRDCLIRAVYENKASAVASLLEAGADPAVGDELGQTPLHWAAREGHEAAAFELLHRVSATVVNVRNRSGATPLHLAAEGNYDATVKLLLRHSADLAATDSGGRTALHMAAERGGAASVAAMLDISIADGQEPAIAAALKANARGDVPLACAAARGHTSIVQMLLEARAHPDGRGRGDQTALHLASRGGHIDVVEALLRVGANPNAVARDGSTTLHAAANADNGAAEIFDLLVDYGGHLDARMRAGMTPLHVAADRAPDRAPARRHRGANEADIGRAAAEAAQALLELRADPDARAEDGRTPLDFALARGQQKVIDALSGGPAMQPEAAMPSTPAADPADRESDTQAAQVDVQVEAAVNRRAAEPGTCEAPLSESGPVDAQQRAHVASVGPAGATLALAQTPPVAEPQVGPVEEVEQHLQEEEEETGEKNSLFNELHEEPRREVTSGGMQEQETAPQSMDPVSQVEDVAAAASAMGEVAAEAPVSVQESPCTVEATGPPCGQQGAEDLHSAARICLVTLVNAVRSGEIAGLIEEECCDQAEVEDEADEHEPLSASAYLAMALSAQLAPPASLQVAAPAQPEVLWQSSAEEEVRYWRYVPCNGIPVTVRISPELDAPRNGAEVIPGQKVRIVEEQKGVDGILYLQLADGGWIFESKPGVGTMCVRCAEGDEEELSEERGPEGIGEEERSASDDVGGVASQKAGLEERGGSSPSSPSGSPKSDAQPPHGGSGRSSSAILLDGGNEDQSPRVPVAACAGALQEGHHPQNTASLEGCAQRLTSPACSTIGDPADLTTRSSSSSSSSSRRSGGGRGDVVASESRQMCDSSCTGQGSRCDSRGSIHSVPEACSSARTPQELAAAFLDMMREKGKGSVAVTWRRHFDCNGDGLLGFQEFCDVLAGMGYEDDVLKLWQGFENSQPQQHQLGLESFDPEAAHIVNSLSAWMKANGGPVAIFSKIDADASDTLSHDEFVTGLREMGLFDTPGMPEGLDSEESFVAKAIPIIDPWNTGCLLLSEMLFLEPDKRERRRLEKRLDRQRERKDQDREHAPSSASKMLHSLAKQGTRLGGKHWKQALQDEFLLSSTDAAAELRQLAEAAVQHCGSGVDAPSDCKSSSSRAAKATAQRRRIGASSQPRVGSSNSSSTPNLQGGQLHQHQPQHQKLPAVGASASLPRLVPPSKELRRDPTPPRTKPKMKNVYGKKLATCLPAIGGDSHHHRNSVVLGSMGRGASCPSGAAVRQPMDGAMHPRQQEDFFRHGCDRDLFVKYCMPRA